MTYRLDDLESLCSELSLDFNRADETELEIRFGADCVLLFQNMPQDSDTSVGFKGTPWHTHGVLMLMTGNTTYVEFSELDTVRAIVSGEVIVVSRYVLGKLKDRWLAHRDEEINVQHIEAGEELRIQRLV